MAVNHCIENDIMADFLRKHRAEVRRMFALEYHQEIRDRSLIDEGRNAGRIEGKTEGKNEATRDLMALVQALCKDGRNDEIMDIFSSEERIDREIIKYNLTPAKN